MAGILGSGINPYLHSMMGIAPYGLRHSGMAPKGLGYFGVLNRPDGGVSTELSAESDYKGKPLEYPLLVPTLDANEMSLLLKGGKPTPQIYEKAYQYAVNRMRSGMSPFAGWQELRYPTPK